MTVTVRVRDRQGTRDYHSKDLPLALGAGPDAAVRLSGPEQPPTAAFVGRRGGRFYLQAAPGVAALTVNDEALGGTSRWLEPGDRIALGPDRFEVENAGEVLVVVAADAPEPVTEPPLLLEEDEAPDRAADGEAIRPAEFSRSMEALRAPAEPTRRWRYALWLPALLLAGAAWFVFTARPVTIAVEPAPEVMDVSGGLFAPTLGDHYLLRPGSYTLRAAREGYRPLETGFDVSGDGPTELRFEMERLPDVFRISTGEVIGAEVFVDGEPVGVTPVEALQLRAGTHQIRITRPRYKAWEQALEVAGGGNERVLQAELEPNWADVTLTSQPAGASVFVDGVEVGATPLVTPVEAGGRALRVSREGFEPWEGSLTVEAGVDQVLPQIDLKPADGRLRVTSTPAGASVLVNGRYRGQTPLVADVTPGESLRVQLRKAGFATATRSVSVASGDEGQLSVRLEPVLGVVEIVVAPADATIRIDGRTVRPRDGRLELPAVEQRIEVSAEGYAAETVAVTPRPGIVQRVTVELKSLAEAKAAAVPRRIVTAQGQELVLVQGGRFTMGSSRREPGRRSNESLREVEITRPFYLSTTEVANGWFREFRPKHYSGDVGGYGLNDDRLPVVSVTWEDAAAFCNWLSEKEGLPPAYRRQGDTYVAVDPPTPGYRLPTEAEWAWAARYGGTPGEPARYPWGGSMPPSRGAGNFADESARGVLGAVINGYDDSFPVAAPVGTFGGNPLGLKDTGGNVAEWVHDVYGVYPPSSTVDVDPAGAASGNFHVIRGSSWMHASVTELRMSFRDYGDKARPDLGFRIARSAE
ncbi:MAG: PEGA domain-containing protein [Gammaproteobacteria bacterium]